MALVRYRPREEVGNLVFHGEPVENISRPKIICPINNQVCLILKLSSISCSKSIDYCLCSSPRMSLVQLSRESLCLRHVKVAMIHAKKPVKIALLHNILVYELQMPNALAGKKVCGCASNASSAYDRNSGGLQFLQPVNPDFVDCCLSRKIVHHLHVHGGANYLLGLQLGSHCYKGCLANV